MSELEFHRKVLEHFEELAEYKSGLNARALTKIIEGLTELVKVESSVSGAEDTQIHVCLSGFQRK